MGLPPPRPATSVWAAVFVFCTAAALLAVGALLIEPVFGRFVRFIPENYAARARTALAAGKPAQAIAAVEPRIKNSPYDFRAYYLLAQAQQQKGDPQAAAATLKLVLQKVAGARANRVRQTFFSEGETYRRLAECCFAAEDDLQGYEFARIAHDLGLSAAPAPARTNAALAADLLATLLADPRESTATAKLFGLGNGAEKPSCEQATAALAVAARSPLSAAALRALPSTTRAALVAALVVSAASATSATARAAACTTAALAAAAAAIAPLPGGPAALLQAATDLGESRTSDATIHETIRSLSEAARARLSAPIDLARFEVGPGNSAAAARLSLGRKGRAAAVIDTGVFDRQTLIVKASGTFALGLWPVLSIREGGHELTSIYIDSAEAAIWCLPLWQGAAAPKKLDLQFELMNDAFDPVTRDDRNIVIHEVFLQ